MTTEMGSENRIKESQFQIHRNCLYTNSRVNKFNVQVSPFCTFCQQNPNIVPIIEKISHLFYDCEPVQKLWIEVGYWLGSLGVELSLNRINVIFGIH